MTPLQENHLARLKTSLQTLLDAKYRAGQETHGGNLFDLTVTQLLLEALNENIDQATYILTALEKLTGIKDYVNNGHAVEAGGSSGRDMPAIQTPDVRSVGFLPPNQNLY